LGSLDQFPYDQEELSYKHSKIGSQKSNQIITEFYYNNADKVDYCLKNRGKISADQIKKDLGL